MLWTGGVASNWLVEVAEEETTTRNTFVTNSSLNTSPYCTFLSRARGVPSTFRFAPAINPPLVHAFRFAPAVASRLACETKDNNLDLPRTAEEKPGCKNNVPAMPFSARALRRFCD